jgi:hypothetical protein
VNRTTWKAAWRKARLAKPFDATGAPLNWYEAINADRPDSCGTLWLVLGGMWQARLNGDGLFSNMLGRNPHCSYVTPKWIRRAFRNAPKLELNRIFMGPPQSGRLYLRQ